VQVFDKAKKGMQAQLERMQTLHNQTQTPNLLNVSKYSSQFLEKFPLSLGYTSQPPHQMEKEKTK
jgi:hypothetical protein